MRSALLDLMVALFIIISLSCGNFSSVVEKLQNQKPLVSPWDLPFSTPEGTICSKAVHWLWKRCQVALLKFLCKSGGEPITKVTGPLSKYVLCSWVYMAAWANEGLPFMHMKGGRMGRRIQELDKDLPQLKRKVWLWEVLQQNTCKA